MVVLYCILLPEFDNSDQLFSIVRKIDQDYLKMAECGFLYEEIQPKRIWKQQCIINGGIYCRFEEFRLL